MFLQYLILAFFLVTILTPDEAPRSTEYLVTEIDESYSYNLTIRLDKDRESDMLTCMERITGRDLSAADATTVSAVNDGVNLTYLSSRHMLVLSTEFPSPENAKRAHRTGEEIKKYLNIRPAEPTAKTKPILP